MTSHSHPVEELAVACLERMAVEGDEALETMCLENPEHAVALRHLVERLRLVGLTVLPDDDGGLPERFGEYRIQERLGDGGMGVVYLAWQERLQRQVALKLLRPGVLPMPRSRARFRREVEALSRLDHPHICTVYDAGEVDGVPFLAMRYLPGETLAARIERSRQDSESSRAGGTDSVEQVAVLPLLEKVARALDAAHEAGVVHRDVKPANIMIDEHGEPAILDFGLAHDDRASEGDLTGSTDQLGTPSFMAPEQIAPEVGQIDRRTDVYQLGVTAYQCLTRRLPFAVSTREGMYRAILAGDAPGVRGLNRKVGRELSAVVMRAMAREPGRRFGTASEFADELERIRTHRPIRTRRPGPLLRLVHWCQRNRVAAVFLAMLGTGFAVVLYLLSANVAANRQLEVRDLLATAREVAQRSPEIAFKMVREAERREGRIEHVEALQEIMGRLHEFGRIDLGRPVNKPVFSPDGRWLGIPSAGGLFRIRGPDRALVTVVRAGEALTQSFAFAADGSHVAIGTGHGRVLFCDERGDEYAPPLGGEGAGHSRSISCLRYGNGLLLAGCLDGAVSVWNADRERLAYLPPVPPATTAAEFSPDGRYMVLGSSTQMLEPALVRVVELGTEREQSVDGATGMVAINVTTDRFVVCSYDGQLDCWSYDGAHLWGARLDPTERVLPRAVGSHGERLAVAATSGWVRILDWDGNLVRKWRADRSQIDLEFSPDGRFLLTVGYFRQRAQVWDMHGNEVAALVGHLDGLNGASFAPDSAGVVSGSTDGTVRFWRLRQPDERVTHVSEWGLAEGIFAIAHSPHRDAYVAASLGGPLLILDGEFRVTHQLERVATWLAFGPRFASDGRRVGLIDSGGGRVLVLDLDRGALDVVARVPNPAENTFSIPLHDDRIVTNDAGGVIVLDPATGTSTPLLVGSGAEVARTGPVGWMDMPEDRRQLLTTRYDGDVRIWNFRDGRLEQRRELPHPNMVFASVFFRDGERLLTGCDDGIARLWDLASGGEPIELGTHMGHVRTVCLSPDESLALTGSSDGTVRVWDAATGALKMMFRGYRGTVWSACFTPDGRQVIGSSQDGTLRRWWIDREDALGAADALGIPALTDAERDLIDRMQRR